MQHSVHEAASVTVTAQITHPNKTRTRDKPFFGPRREPRRAAEHHADERHRVPQLRVRSGAGAERQAPASAERRRLLRADEADPFDNYRQRGAENRDHSDCGLTLQTAPERDKNAELRLRADGENIAVAAAFAGNGAAPAPRSCGFSYQLL